MKIGSNLTLPDEAVTQTFGILAKRGVGKTYLALVMAEEMLEAGHQVIIADPVGVCWGLRSSASGKSAGLPIAILGGDHGDIPLEPTSGELVAETAVASGASMVLDLSLLRKGESVRLMTAFAETLYHRNRRPVHLILDEADAFAPQRPQKGTERMLGAVEDLVRRGRARGIGVTMTTQRPAVLNKDVLTQIEVLVCLRMVSPQDRAAIDDWVKIHGTPAERDELMRSIASLPIGTAWFWSPGWLDVFKRVEVRKRKTFDSSATPQAGQARRELKRLADVDLQALKGRMQETIQAAAANDPKRLKRRIAELEKQLQSAETETKIERVEVPALSEEAEEAITAAVHRVEEAANQLDAAIDKLGMWPWEVKKAASRMNETAEAKHNGRRTVHNKAPILHRRASSTTAVSPSSKSGQQRMLQALAQFPEGMDDAKLAMLTGVKKTGGTFSTYLGRLRGAGQIEGDRSCLRITPAGIEAAGDFEPLPTRAELIAFWQAKIGTGGMRRMFDCLVEAYPRALSKEELAQSTGITASGGTFSTYLGRLRTLDLIDGSAELRASEVLFE